MASSQTIVIDRLLLIAKLKDVLVKKQKEYDEWSSNQKTYKKRLEAWEKKAHAYILKNGAPEKESVNTYGSTASIRLEVNLNELVAAIGESPSNEREPEFFVGSYYQNRRFTPCEEVKNAIALYELSTETTVKVSNRTLWAAYLV